MDMREEDLLEIEALFVEDGGESVDMWIDQSRLFITGNENELMLRFNENTSELVIARILFKNTRRGYGTKLLTILEVLARKYGYYRLVAESVMTEEMENFLIGKGFEQKEDFYGYSTCLDWYKEIH